MKFEEKLKKLEEITQTLQNPDTDIAKAVELYEEGMKLAKEADLELSKLERRVEIVTSEPGENPEGVISQTYTV